VCSSLKNACARKEKVKKNANVPCHFFVQTLPCKLPPHQRERIQQEKDGTDKKEICDKFSSPLEPLCQKMETLKSSEKE